MIARGIIASKRIGHDANGSAKLIVSDRSSGVSMLAVPALTIFGAAFAAALPAVFRAVRLDPARTLRAE